MDLDEAKEHLGSLTRQMAEGGAIDEGEFSVQMGHIFGHLSRNWNSRSLEGEIPKSGWAKYSQLPTDLETVG